MRNAPKGVENGGRGGENFYWAAGGHFLLPPEVTEQIAKVKCFKVVPGGWSRGFLHASVKRFPLLLQPTPGSVLFFTLFLCVYPLLPSAFSAREMEVKGAQKKHCIYIYMHSNKKKEFRLSENKLK